MKLPTFQIKAKTPIERAVIHQFLGPAAKGNDLQNFTVDSHALANAGIDVHALAEAATAAGDPTGISLDVLKTFPGTRSLQSIGSERRVTGDPRVAAQAAKLKFETAGRSVVRATTHLRRLDSALDAFLGPDAPAPDGKAPEFTTDQMNKLAKALGTDRKGTMGKTIGTLQQCAKDLEFLYGPEGCQTLWSSSAEDRGRMWPAATDLLEATEGLIETMQKIGRKHGDAATASVAVVLASLLPSLERITDKLEFFRPMTETLGESQVDAPIIRVGPNDKGDGDRRTLVDLMTAHEDAPSYQSYPQVVVDRAETYARETLGDDYRVSGFSFWYSDPKQNKLVTLVVESPSSEEAFAIDVNRKTGKVIRHDVWD